MKTFYSKSATKLRKSEQNTKRKPFFLLFIYLTSTHNKRTVIVLKKL